MRCASCGDVIGSERDVVWVRGTAICPACAAKGRTIQKTFLTVWLVFVLLMFALPLALCVGAVVLFGFLR